MLSNQLEHRLLSQLKLKHLQLLVVLDEQRNISRASKKLNMAQPAATKNIKSLETLLEMTLFKRSSRGVVPTLYGETLIKYAKLILAQVRHASEELISLKNGSSGHLTIGTLLAASAILIPKALLAMKAERPDINITLIEGTNDKLMPALRVGEIDAVIGRLPEFREREGLKQHPLYEEPVSIVVRKGHPLLKYKQLELKDISKHDWILPLSQTTLRRQIESAFRNSSLELPHNTIESISMLVNHKLLIETDMIAVMPFQAISSYSDLACLPIQLEETKSCVGVTVRSQDFYSPTLQYFLDTLDEVLKADYKYD
ncbi:MAG: LysR family transcriptional regulator [Emcibacteraceae bacterium]|nr:LysR family transcriptional regulator [Emcibacteraceae bacterium]